MTGARTPTPIKIPAGRSPRRWRHLQLEGRERHRLTGLLRPGRGAGAARNVSFVLTRKSVLQ